MNILQEYMTIETTNFLATKIRQLMAAGHWNECDLARKANLPQPTLHKILTGKTEDPRYSTLRALANCFNVSIEELMNSAPNKPLTKSTQQIAVHSWQSCVVENFLALSPNEILLSEFISANAFALRSKPAMVPFFKLGTYLIINPDLSPKDGDIVLLHYPHTTEATLRLLTMDGPTFLLQPLQISAENSLLADNIRILGVITKQIYNYQQNA